MQLRQSPALLDSVDVSTPQQHARTGRIAGRSRKPVYYGPASGEDIATTTGRIATAELVELSRMLSPSITTEADLQINWEKLPYDEPETAESSDEPRQPSISDPL